MIDLTLDGLTKRQVAILKAMAADPDILIHRSWRGSNYSGYLSHTLRGFDRLREAEIQALWRLGFLKIKERRYATFHPYQLTDDARAAIAKAEARS